MQIRKLGRTGLKVSEICLGTMTFGLQADEDAAFAIMGRASEAGVNFIDTADVYPVPVSMDLVGSTEEIVGKWLKGKRDNFILATKCRANVGPFPWNSGLSRKHIIEAVEASLKRLQTDYIDLYQAHSPDPETPIEETLRAFDDLVRSGKVRYIGCSNYQAWQLALALGTSEKLGISRFDCLQPRYNILFRQIEDETLPLCRHEGLGVIVYNPLAGGFLTGKHSREEPEAGSRFDITQGPGSFYHARYWQDAQFEVVEKLKKYFESRDKTLAQAAIAFVLQQPGITSAILGASKPSQLEETLHAVNITLDDEELEVCAGAWYALPRRQDASVALR